MNSIPDLYAMFQLDRSDSANDLGRSLANRDQELERQMVPEHDPRRRQVHTAFAVLSDERRRSTYDDALRASLNVSWSDLEHLGTFGSFPDPSIMPPQQRRSAADYGYPTHTATPPSQSNSGLVNPFELPAQAPSPAPMPAYQPQPSYSASPAGASADRPPGMTRLGMMLLDGLLVTLIAGVVLTTGIAGSSDSGMAILSAMIGAAWGIGFEVLTGASPVKHLFGYQVRDSTTGEKLSWEQSAKRQWWRLVNIIPGIGQVITFFGMIAIGMSIKESNGFIGSHDRWAGAEVVRKPGR
ncbi:MAG: RDD family protein [Corynebacterium sp.]|uniref:RDD family protein n=1 Tax=Corynebacterium sp. TaxID=1720 RepID=UPI0026E0E06F|nr:RDD family protein [Corynebacterium sp.]MDO5669863.1 RDD family protein [Corynebacterium sp.]